MCLSCWLSPWTFIVYPSIDKDLFHAIMQQFKRISSCLINGRPPLASLLPCPSSLALLPAASCCRSPRAWSRWRPWEPRPRPALVERNAHMRYTDVATQSTAKLNNVDWPPSRITFAKSLSQVTYASLFASSFSLPQVSSISLNKLWREHTDTICVHIEKVFLQYLFLCGLKGYRKVLSKFQQSPYY